MIEVNGLVEAHVAVVVAGDQQHRRAPAVDVRDRRGRPRPRLVGVGETPVAPLLARHRQRPVVHAVQIDPRREQVRVARQRQRRQVAAVGTAPEADAVGVDRVEAGEVLARREHIEVLAGAAGARIRRQVEVAAVADTGAVVERQHDKTAAGEILVHRIGVRVVAAVVPAEQHLPDRPAVQEDHRRALAVLVIGQKQLLVQRQAIRRGHAHGLWRLQAVGGKRFGRWRRSVSPQLWARATRSRAGARSRPSTSQSAGLSALAAAPAVGCRP